MVAVLAFVVSTQYLGERRVVRTRNFYGALQIRDSGEGDSAARALYSGRTIHGLAIPVPCPPAHSYDLLRRPNRASGRVLGSSRHGEAARGNRGAGRRHAGRLRQERRFLPLLRNQSGGDPGRHGVFDFLRDSAAATDVVPGDGRLMLDREPPHSFDIVVLDAFSDDAIPVHLLTRQAFEVYFDRLRPGGLLLIHLSNRYLDLSAEVEALAADLRKLVLSHPQRIRSGTADGGRRLGDCRRQR